jgi:regulator of sigma E protease
MLGGVTVNFILGFLLFGMVLFVWGSEYLPTTNIPDGYYVDSLAMQMGLQNGDKILQVGNHSFDRYDIGAFKKEIVINDAQDIKVERDGREVDLTIDDSFVSKLSSYAYKDAILFVPRTPTIIKAVAKNTAAERAGLQPEDKIIAINDIETPFYDQFRKVALENKGAQLVLRLIRNGREEEVRLQSDENGLIGFEAKNYLDLYETERQDYTVAEAIPAGFVKGYDFLAAQIKAFGKMFRGKIKATESLGGFITISKLFPDFWSWEVFWHTTAVLSLILGFMNLLPIPALDGGHVMFLIYEVVTGRKVSDKFMEYATIVGFAIVIGLVLFANGLDVLRLLNPK